MQSIKAILVLAILFFSSKTIAIELSTNFEFQDTSGLVTLFDEPNQLTITGGEVKVVGDTDIYLSGIRAFMYANETARFDFQTPVESVQIFLINQDPGIDSRIEAYEVGNDTPVATLVGEFDVWGELNYTSEVGISHLLAINNSFGYAAAEDLTITTFDEPPVQAPDELADPIPTTIAQSSIEVNLEPISSSLSLPLFGTTAPSVDGFMYVIDQTGFIWALNTSTNEFVLVADLSTRISTGFEKGLIGLAFHPNFATNGLLYTHTSEPVNASADFTTLMGGESADHYSVIAEWRATLGGDAGIEVDLNSRREVLTVAQPQVNHNAGALVFDESGYLYIPLGDGGGADDEGVGHSTGGNGQDATNVLGTILRIEPLGTDGFNGQYGIPVDNPFISDSVIPNEIFAYGLRNPYSLTLDQATNRLITADVGQNDIEEINIVEAGDNFGWPAREGSFGFFQNDASNGYVFTAEPDPALKDPWVEYDHDEGIAVLGGHVYRGSDIQELAGRYLFGDLLGRLFIINASNVIEELVVPENFDGLNLLGFGVDNANETYVFAFNQADNQSAIFKMAPVTTPGGDAGDDTGGDSGGDAGGDAGGDTGGDAGGNSGGNTGGAVDDSRGSSGGGGSSGFFILLGLAIVCSRRLTRVLAL